jgi:transposase
MQTFAVQTGHTFTATNGFNILEWPAQSPELSPIENLWDKVEEDLKLRKVQPKNKGELFQEAR